ncbi:MAG: carboxylesterase family protein [Fimbriimonadaceae bacterium]
MPSFLAVLLATQVAPAPFWQLSDAIAISRVSRGGRVPFPEDDVLGMLVKQGDQTSFRAGDALPDRGGVVRRWTAVKANAKGAVNQPRAGYVQAIIHSDTDRPAILTVSGDAALYFNGSLRPGDVYGYGYLSLPVQVRRGDNTLLVAAGRGPLTARLDAPRADQQFNLADSTLPDVLTTDHGKLKGAVVILNTSAKPATALRIRATVGDRTVESRLPEIGPFTLRKTPFEFPVVTARPGSTEHISLSLVGPHGEQDQGVVDVNVVAPLTTHKRTFISNIDGSVQYYAVVPAQKPSKSNALVLTLHGASVEAIGQARAYQAKDWCTIVAPTNRRPYGFDWEDTGRLDALEVLQIAKKAYAHDPARVVLTGHSMGGHGTWSIGTLYPNLFAAIAPSAGWVSFQSYAGGFRPPNPDPVAELFLRAAAPSDTLGRVRNTLEGTTYILHGSADDNVPVTEARTMKKALTDIGANFVYHEQPGAGHWWGNQCVDWPPLFQTLRAARLKAANDPAPIDFTSPNPEVSSTLRWVTIERQQVSGISSVQAAITSGVIEVTTTNVGALELSKPRATITSVVVDGVAFPSPQFPLRIVRPASTTFRENTAGWTDGAHWAPDWKTPARSGGFKLAFQHDMVFVVGSTGADATRLWDFARYLAESLYYRGNGAVDVWTDADYLKRRKTDRRLRDRNVVLFGNEENNAAWKELLRNCPIKVTNGNIRLARGGALDPSYPGDDEAALVTYPLPGSATALVAAFGESGAAAIDALERVPVLPSGTAYPDWSILNAETEPSAGINGVAAAGNFGPNWQLGPESTFRKP